MAVELVSLEGRCEGRGATWMSAPPLGRQAGEATWMKAVELELDEQKEVVDLDEFLGNEPMKWSRG
eukprot:4259322-Heterocapsa_arctica.AAC.1